jgi:hypothetical protein
MFPELLHINIYLLLTYLRFTEIGKRRNINYFILQKTKIALFLPLLTYNKCNYYVNSFLYPPPTMGVYLFRGVSLISGDSRVENLFQQNQLLCIGKIVCLQSVEIRAAGDIGAVEINNVFSCSHLSVNKRFNFSSEDIEYFQADE